MTNFMSMSGTYVVVASFLVLWSVSTMIAHAVGILNAIVNKKTYNFSMWQPILVTTSAVALVCYAVHLNSW